MPRRSLMLIGIDASNLRYGGGLTHLAEMLGAARPEAHGVERVIVWAGNSTLGALPERSWLERAHVPALDGGLPQRLFWQWEKLPALAAKSCELLFVPGGNVAPATVPVVTMSRNMLPFERKELRRFGLSWNALRLCLLGHSQVRSFRRAEGLIFLTEYARSKVMERAVRLNGLSVVIPHGLNERFRRPPRAQRPLEEYSPEEPFKLLYVSTISVYKHQDQVAAAVHGLRRQGLPIELNLIGPAYGPALKRLRDVLSRFDPGGTFIRYHGAVPFQRLHTMYHGADAFIFASSCENMPNILIEAMAAGLPIACSDRGPMPEVLGTGGFYFNPEDPKMIADSLRNLIESPALREQRAHIAYERAQRYSWERCADETFSFLLKVVSASAVKGSPGVELRPTSAAPRADSDLSRDLTSADISE